jgi:hypothetical protein
VIREQLVTARDRTWDGRSACSTITVHETANTRVGANAQAHANLQSNGNVRQASWHIQVDDVEAIRSFPDEVRCWHAGRAAEDSIAVEVCVNADGDYDQALANAARVVATLRETHGLGRDALRLHHDWTGKNCPSRLIASGEWQAFVASTDPVQPAPPPTVGNADGSASAGGGKSVATMASEVLAGLHGNGHDVRRRSLGISAVLYEQVRAEVNRRAGMATPPVPTAPTGRTIAQMATEVLNGKHGNGHDRRRRSLGVTAAVYEQVRAEVNRRARGAAPTPSPIRSVSAMASEVIDGKHGNGHATRRRSLGISEALYAQVRAEVNRRLR